ncbi:unnamed protein product [Echinostoma caproni]|uniref:TLC domain-containing protein n=1 Tax=Echinostoma caproni TaxID=27848 RepID=A0A183A236_9TREM|nr:unnamed protein product [Echinostoma caproni]
MDAIHMYRFEKTKETYELIVHHAVILLCFSSAIVSGKYIGYSVVALLVEVNSVFLQLRRILRYLFIPKGSIFRDLCLSCLRIFLFTHIFFQSESEFSCMYRATKHTSHTTPVFATCSNLNGSADSAIPYRCLPFHSLNLILHSNWIHSP